MFVFYIYWKSRISDAFEFKKKRKLTMAIIC